MRFPQSLSEKSAFKKTKKILSAIDLNVSLQVRMSKDDTKADSSMDSNNHELKIFQKNYTIAGVY